MTPDAESRTHGPTEQPRRRRRVWWLLATAFVVVPIGVGAVVYVRVTDPEHVRRVAEDYLQRHASGPVSIRAAAFSWTEGVRLFDVSIGSTAPNVDDIRSGDRPSAPPSPDVARPILTCREIRLRFNPIAALTGDLQLRSVTVIEPFLDVTRKLGGDPFDLSGFLRFDRLSKFTRQSVRPTLELRDARLRVRVQDVAAEDRSSELALSVRALPSDDARFAYDVVWESAGADGHTRIDARSGMPIHVAGGLPPMSLDMAAFISGFAMDGAAAMADSLAATGIVRVTNYSLPQSKGDTGGVSATIALHDIALSIPLDARDREVAPELRYARLEGVAGQMQWSDGRLRADLSGRLHGSDCTLALTLTPSSTAAFTLLDECRVEGRLMVHALALPRSDEATAPAEAGLIRRLPALATLYDEFDPRGLADLDVSFAKRAGTDNAFTVTRATLQLSDGAASLRSAGVSLSDVAGTIDYSSDGIVLRELRGRHGDTTVRVDGRLSGFAPSAEKRLTIQAKDVPLGDELWAHLPERYAAERRRFGLEGRIDATVELHQPAAEGGDPRPWSVSATMELNDVSVLAEKFPYPMEQLSGVVELSRGGLKLRDVHGRAGRGKVRFDGDVAFDEDGIASLDLAIVGRGLAFDDQFLAALPQKSHDLLIRFHPAGIFDIDTTLSFDAAAGKVTPKSVVTLRGASMNYDMFPVELTDMLGRVTVSPGTILVDGVTGRYRSATFSIDGNVAPNPKTGKTALRVHGRDIILDPALRAALPAGARRGLKPWTIEGPIVADVVLTGRRPGARGLGIHTKAKLIGGRVSHPFFPVPFEQVTADVTVDRDGFRTNGVTAKYGEADVSAEVSLVTTDAGSEGLISIEALGLTLDDSVRGLGYGRIADLWDRLSPSGSADVHLSELRFKPGAVDGPKEWTVSGYMDFSEVAIAGFGDAKRATGSLLAEGTLIDAGGNSSLSGRIALAKAELVGQRVTATDGSWSFAGRPDGEGIVALRDLQGRIYNGAWMSDVDVHFGDGRVAYDLKTTLRRMQIQPLLNAETAARRPGSEPVDVSGLVSGRLHLSGVVGDSSTRSGRGGFEITDGRMYRLPVVLAILNVLKLSSPTDEAFDQAQAGFSIDGNRIELDDIRLRGTSLALRGRGTMNWPDRGVDLSLIVSSRQWLRLPILAEFAENAAGEIVQLQVTGPIYQPNVQTRTFRGLTDELKLLFQKKEPKKIQPPR